MGSLSYTPRARIYICLFVRWVGSLSYTPYTGNCLSVGEWIVSVLRPVLNSVWSFFGWGVSLTRPVLESNFSFGGWGVSYMPRTGICSSGGSLSYSSRTEICLVVRKVGTFSRTPRAGIFVVVGRVSVLHVVSWHLSRRSSGGEFLLHVSCCSLSRR